MSKALMQLSASDLRRAADLRSQIEVLEARLAKVLGGTSTLKLTQSTAAAPAPKPTEPVKRTMSAAARARIAAGQKKRWAKLKAASAKAEGQPKRTLSQATRARGASVRAGEKAR